MHPDADHEARINALPAEHFKPLLEWLPRLQQPPAAHTEEELAHPAMQFMDADGTPTFSIPGNTSEVDTFIRLCYDLGLVFSCDWTAFMDAYPFHQQPDLIDRFDRLQCFHALTALIRSDRFSEGTVAHAWKKGVLARVVGRLGEVVG